MPRILLADDSPHAQRMGERILQEEGFEVFTVPDGDSALVSLTDVQPDLILADMFLPRRSGRDLCRFVKTSERFRHLPVVLTLGALEQYDEEDIARVAPDGVLRKPFEASVVLGMIGPLISEGAAGKRARDAEAEAAAGPAGEELPPPAAGMAQPVTATGPDQTPAGLADESEQRVRAAVTVALDRVWPHLVDEITAKVLLALRG